MPADPELTLKPNIKKTLRKEMVVERFQCGKYEDDRFGGKGKVWSCSMNPDPNF